MRNPFLRKKLSLFIIPSFHVRMHKNTQVAEEAEGRAMRKRNMFLGCWRMLRLDQITFPKVRLFNKTLKDAERSINTLGKRVKDDILEFVKLDEKPN